MSKTSPTPVQIATPPTVYVDSDGNYINTNGWSLPPMAISSTNFSPVSKTQQKPAVYTAYYLPKDNLTVSQPSNTENGIGLRVNYIFSVTAYKGKDQAPYCYRFAAYAHSPESNMNNTGMLIQSFLCDMNGDGLYEAYSWQYHLPNWVK